MDPINADRATPIDTPTVESTAPSAPPATGDAPTVWWSSDYAEPATEPTPLMVALGLSTTAAGHELARQAIAKAEEADMFPVAASDCPSCHEGPEGLPPYDPRRDAATLAVAAVSAHRDSETLRGMLDTLGPDAVSLVGAMSKDHGPMTAERSEAVTMLLRAASLSPPSEGSAATVLAVFEQTAPWHFDRSPELAGALAHAFGAHWAASPASTDRLEELFADPGVRDALFGPTQTFGSRAQLLDILRQNPDITAKAIAGDAPWANEAVLAAHLRPKIERHHDVRGDAGVRAEGKNVDNFVGVAMNMAPSGIPSDDGASYFTGEAAEIIAPVAASIRDVGGPNAEIAVIPITFSSADTGPVDLPLFRVTNPDTGSESFVDNRGRSYDSFEDWISNNTLPPGRVAFPKGGRLGDGDPEILVQDTETWLEWAGGHVDTAMLVGGTVAAGALIFGSGGALTPVAVGMVGAASAWGALRSGANLLDRAQHGQTLSLGDREARAEWLAFGASALGLMSLGATSFAMHAANGAKLSRGAATVVGGINVAGTAADFAGAGDSMVTLVGNWDELSNAEAAGLVLQIAFWGTSSGVAARRSNTGARGMFDPRTIRDELMAVNAARYAEINRPPTFDEATNGLDGKLTERLKRVADEAGESKAVAAALALDRNPRARDLVERHGNFGLRALADADGNVKGAEQLLIDRVQVVTIGGQLFPPTAYGGDRFYGSSAIDLEVLFARGLPEGEGRTGPVGTNVDLVDHKNQVAGSALMGTTVTPLDSVGDQGAGRWAEAGGFAVKIDGMPTWDVNATMEGNNAIEGVFKRNNMSGEGEHSMARNVPPERIVGVYRIVDHPATFKLKLGEFIPNPNYKPR